MELYLYEHSPLIRFDPDWTSVNYESTFIAFCHINFKHTYIIQTNVFQELLNKMNRIDLDHFIRLHKELLEQYSEKSKRYLVRTSFELHDPDYISQVLCDVNDNYNLYLIVDVKKLVNMYPDYVTAELKPVTKLVTQKDTKKKYNCCLILFYIFCFIIGYIIGGIIILIF